jgi:TolB-like protein
MFRRLVPLLALAALLVAPTSVSAQDEMDRRPGIAVLRFDNSGSHGEEAEAENFAALEIGLQQMLITELAQNPALRVVERAAIDALLEEQGLTEEGRVDPSTAVDLGRLVQARYVVLGNFMDLYGEVRMDARVVEVETSETLRGRAVMGPRRDIYRLLVDLSQELTRELELPRLPAPEVEERREREIPDEAVVLYSQALYYEGRGRTDEARELLQRVTAEFPQFVEAREQLQQLPTG